MLLTAEEAASRLGIKRETLYAYVARGRLRSLAVPGSRERHYRPEDVDALRAGRSRPAAIAADAGDAVMPIVDSAICLIEGGRLYYRGQDAIRLSDKAALEDVARLLWGDYPDAAAAAPAARSAGGKAARGGDAAALVARCQLRLAALAAADPAPAAGTRDARLRTGQRILRELVGCVTGAGPQTAPVHRQLEAHWHLAAPAAEIVRRCLVLVADHELNPSTFAARCVASTGAGLFAAVSAALGALSGPRHGGAADRVEALFRAAAATGDPIAAVAERLAQGESLPGIGQALYPDGDPRAVAILYALSAIVPQVRRLVGRRPNVDFALGAAATLLGLPQGAALGLFVIGRTVGWIAHALEQYDSGVLIRPRARYTGPRPVEEKEA